MLIPSFSNSFYFCVCIHKIHKVDIGTYNSSLKVLINLQEKKIQSVKTRHKIHVFLNPNHGLEYL